MTYNKLKKLYKGYRFRTGKKDWEIIEKTKGKCLVINYDVWHDDEEVFFEVT